MDAQPPTFPRSPTAALPVAPLPPGEGPYQNHAAILDLVNRKKREWSAGREGFTISALRNLRYYRGQQWEVYDRTLRRFRPSRLRKGTPTPVTNRFASTMDAFMSVLSRVEPQPKFPPATDDPEDQATADVCDRVIEVIEDECNIRVQRQFLATWTGLTAGSWAELGYDPDPIHGTRLIQDEQCLACGGQQPPSESGACQGEHPTMPGMPCGSQLMIPATDPTTGQPVGREMPVGKMYTDVVPLFEMFFDPAITDWKKQRAFLRAKSVSLDEAKARWTQLQDAIVPDSMATTGEFYGDQLPTLPPGMEDSAGGRYLGGLGQKQPSNTRVTEQWFWQMPDATYPQGLLAIVLGKTQVAYAAKLPYTRLTADGHKQPFLPYTFFPQKLVPGSAWPKTIADDLAYKQAQRNRLEAIAEMTAMRMSNPVWLIPTGANVRNVTGDPGQMIEYNALGPSPAKPERIPGQNISATLVQMIELIDRDFEELAGTFDILKGGRPQGISAGIALQILKERGESRFAPMFILWEDSWAEWASQALEIFREYATEDRLKRIKGRDGAWEVQKFLGADLKGRINVVPEASSSFPKSTLTERAEVEQLIAQGVLTPADPETRFKILESYGKTDYLPGMAADTKNAMMENEVFQALAADPRLQQADAQLQQYLSMAADLDYMQIVADFKHFGVELPPIYPSLDDHGIHAREHKKFGKTTIFRQYPKVLQFLFEKMVAYHEQLATQALMAMQQARQGTHPTSGFLSNPGGQSSPMNAGSSPQRMAGDAHEMQHDMLPAQH